MTYEELQVRIDLAAAYRLAALNGWDDTVYTHLSASVPVMMTPSVPGTPTTRSGDSTTGAEIGGSPASTAQKPVAQRRPL